MAKAPKKVLVIRFSSIGDIILTTPLLKEFKNKYPDTQVDFLVLRKFAEAIRGVETIDKLITFDKDKYKGIAGIKAFTKTLDSDYDLVIDLHSKLRSKLIKLFLGKKSYTYKKRSLLKTLLVKSRLIRYSVSDSIVSSYFNALTKLEVYYQGEDLEFYYSEEDLKKVANYNNFIVLSPGASKNTKMWPANYYGELAKLLSSYYQKQIIVIGGKGDKSRGEAIKESCPEAINLCGQLSLKESGALLSKASFVVTNDSGPFHMARGVKTKAFVIFGPTDSKMFDFQEDKYGYLIKNNVKCAPCSLHGDKECPKKHFKCMEEMLPKTVFKIIKSKITAP